MKAPKGSWRDAAVCAQTDPEAFFPEKSAGPVLAQRAVCARCPVRAQCLASALENNENYGIWGGLTARERRGLRKAS